MGAFRRRTQFAAPLIISVAAAGCGSKSSEPPPPEKQIAGPKNREPSPPKTQFAGPMWSVWMQLPGCKAAIDMRDVKCPPDVECNLPNPPAPQDVECPPGASGKTTQYIAQLADQSCVLVPPGCIELACARTPTPCPLPPGTKLVAKIVFAWKIEKRGEGCHAEEEDHDCPPGVDCNPPKPRMVPCPPGITEEKDLAVTQLADGTCAVVPEGCTDVSCVTDKTPCPPPL